MTSPRESTQQTSVGALIASAIVGAVIVLVLFAGAAARTSDVRVQHPTRIDWRMSSVQSDTELSAPQADVPAADPQFSAPFTDSTIVQTGSGSR